jgi:dTDP-4-amino-4,6-dideoxygalactose transaminase
MSPSALQKFLYERTRKKNSKLTNKRTGRVISAIVPVHLYGQCADMHAIMRIARKYNLIVIEDCAQSHGAMIGTKKSGTFGHAAAFSFYPTKNLGCFGDGGMVVTNNAEIDKRVRMLRNYGQADRYVHEMKGINSRLDEVQAAALSVKLKKLDENNNMRRSLTQKYCQLLKGLPISFPQERPGHRHVYHLFVIRVKHRDALKEYLFKHGVMAQIHYPIPIHLQKSYVDLSIPSGSLAIAEQAANEVLSLPFFPGITNRELLQVAHWIKQYFKHHGE